MNKNLKIISITIIFLIALFFGLRGKITHEKFDSEKCRFQIRGELEYSLGYDEQLEK